MVPIRSTKAYHNYCLFLRVFLIANTKRKTVTADKGAPIANAEHHPPPIFAPTIQFEESICACEKLFGHCGGSKSVNETNTTNNVTTAKISTET